MNNNIQEIDFIDPDLITNDVLIGAQGQNLVNKNDMNCPICHGVFIDPVSCGNCLNHFCRKCISQRYDIVIESSLSEKCPLCKQVFSLKRAVPLLLQMLGSLNLKCPNNTNGCTQIIKYEKLKRHLAGCWYCFTVCNATSPKNNKKKCTKLLLKADLKNHMEVECIYRICECTHCLKEFAFIDLKNHDQVCEDKLIVCEKCSSLFKRSQIDNHLINCPKNIQQCVHCNENMMYKDLITHEPDCSSRIIICLGCSLSFKLCDYFQHQVECEQFPIICSLCKAQMPRKQFMSHTSTDCIKFLRKELDQGFDLINNQIKTQQDLVLNKKNSIRFSNSQKDSDIHISPNRMTAFVKESRKKRKDRFALFSRPFNLQDKWKMKCLTVQSEWYAIGITDGSSLYKTKRYQEIGHGSYLISANGTLYSNHCSDSNWTQTDFRIASGDILSIWHDKNFHLIVENETKNQKIEIEVVLDNIPFYGCVCLRAAGDQIQLDI